ncbi:MULTISPECIES: chorismate-binding protein [unclassified Bradyrhizobium]|uniref:chorismate-binding protein n=1 Tax=unclassified Bradyrhizobium TaxID=2631580 RepID=UPI001FFA160A|nr:MULTISPECIES: chorismate-binding protein [unclassified Bradyrhizobium]
MLVLSTGWPEQDPVRRRERARRTVEEFVGLVTVSAPSFTPGQAVTAVQRVIDLSGDAFQVNIAQRFSARLANSFDLIAFYCQLRKMNSAPFADLLRYGKLTIASSSPEHFTKV